MSGEFIPFFVLAVLAIGGAVFMLNFTRVVHMALSLALTLLSIAGIFVLLNAEFLAAVQVLVYTGAVSILMLFGIMLTRHREEEEEVRPWQGFLSFVGVGSFLGILIYAITNTPFSGTTAKVDDFTVAWLGKSLFKEYVIPFELLSILLLVALVGAVILAGKESKS